ncbi:hypothetical protein A3K48_07710 [candidate division WOR-1 bacterium RIFOXYA12_FULL_52_29]|uniref:KilA-N DNA-binding domain-containing protein n=1 Tax=candidate division WOR-1 bacterium RIFOXYC12_FULL_54_18 TaxID=1802584 RepID=A0A1F4T9R4_UNCSA|nr:MAG: hypothetical protein A3K44_07710 [candidate division WOR-1 bacterium RIFOXYA2_FULL_51_19]OGC18396.1 MAG: hypothetical protein A3K48_07710 [candidate division WOR-1 bacterium RIFOXYA12_FULL_52_29]OGC27251.1 MAG: hypothetical protein A3K32_07705 [candidate division WOR-1 bacterium RIFOXYB2_FULL_45_9]OGC28813.1 MAG: hypothetical protein A3K49_07710 [candidate division WOR-1 bacterium RIFOXYC12_FULL_54_18]OGC30733.1 MAG: hypothetical protein A2346_04905 [candidate division WOR-1 bacterium R
MTNNELIPLEAIQNKIYMIRGQKVMLDRDLAELYGIPTGTLNQAVSRNQERFPNDFMFSLSKQEIQRISQIVISSPLKYHKNINVFTENGVAMLSSVLRSKQAVQVNIQIMRIFTKLRNILAQHKELIAKINELEQKTGKNSSDIQLIFEAIHQMLTQPEKPTRIGFI